MNDEQILGAWVEGTTHFARVCQDLPASAIRRTLDVLNRGEKTPPAVFFLEAMRVSPLREKAAWREALHSWVELASSHRGDSQFVRDCVAKYANSPLLPAIQAAVVSGDDVPFRFLAVLAHDASDVSLDALVIRFADRKVDLDRLRALRLHAAPTPEMTSFLDGIEHKRDSAVAGSPALTFARSIGLDVAVFRADVLLLDDSGEDTLFDRTPYANIRFESRSPSWFVVEHELDDTQVIDPHQLPQWIAAQQQALGLRWDVSGALVSSLKGKNRATFLNWLFAPSNRVAETPRPGRRGDARDTRR